MSAGHTHNYVTTSMRIKYTEDNDGNRWKITYETQRCVAPGDCNKRSNVKITNKPA